MAKKNRDTLKNYFSHGNLPTQEHFEDLIDSMLNVIDEGFEKTPDYGFEVAQLGDSGKLISFFENISVKSPLWTLSFDSSEKHLAFGNADNPHVLVLASESIASDNVGESKQQARVGINKKNPQYELDVDGVVAARGRIGSRVQKQVLADGQWHDITASLDGCQAYEVMAGVGLRKTGKYALLHAFALNAYNHRSRIDCHPAYYGSRCDQLELRWHGEMHDFTLQIRSKCSFTENDEQPVMIGCYLTQLWFDPFMEQLPVKE